MATIDFGTIQHNGITIRLLQEAYIDSLGQDERPFYAATGCDGKSDYRIRWAIKDGLTTFDAGYDEDTASSAYDGATQCDWDTPYEVSVIGLCDHDPGFWADPSGLVRRRKTYDGKPILRNRDGNFIAVYSHQVTPAYVRVLPAFDEPFPPSEGAAWWRAIVLVN